MTREQDIEVAQALGWKQEGHVHVVWLSPDGRRVNELALPHYSTDIAAAMTLVDPTIEHGWRFILERGPGGRWVALFMNEDFCCIERAETAAQAIVAAFLSVSDTMQQVKEMQ